MTMGKEGLFTLEQIKEMYPPQEEIFHLKSYHGLTCKKDISARVLRLNNKGNDKGIIVHVVPGSAKIIEGLPPKEG
ncbi:MAG: hypothetical protein ABH816_01595 [Candidatus Levyibacteriota bacterium]